MTATPSDDPRAASLTHSVSTGIAAIHRRMSPTPAVTARR